MAVAVRPAAATPNPLVAAKLLADVPLSQLAAAKAHADRPADAQNPLVVAKAPAASHADVQNQPVVAKALAADAANQLAVANQLAAIQVADAWVKSEAVC